MDLPVPLFLMTELNFKLFSDGPEPFDGPLELLLDLIRKHKLNIHDIEISVLLEQFLTYLERMTEADMEVTSDFLEMAARLILIKSESMLPREEKEKLKQELQGQLIELALAKTMAAKLRSQYQGDAIFVREPVKLDIDMSYRRTHQPEEILLAFGAVSERSRKKAEYEKVPATTVVAKSYISELVGVFAVLKSLRKRGVIEMEELYKGQSRSRKVVTFLAILKLSERGRIMISEDGKSIRLKEDGA